MDLEDICDALAARYVSATIGTPTGALPIRFTYGQAPNSMPATPSVVVIPQRGEMVYNPGQRQTQHEIDVLFYHSKRQGDIPRSETERQRWLMYLLNALHGQAKLGLGSSGVDKALPTNYEFVELPYGGDLYDGIRISVTVWVTESVTLTP